MKSVLSSAAAMALGAVIGAASATSCLQLQERPAPSPTVAPTAVQSPAAAPPATSTPTASSTQVRSAALTLIDEDRLAALFEQASPSVVNIRVRSSPPPDSNQLPEQGTGSGFIIDRMGHIVTNNHVVQDAMQLDVTLADGTRLPAQVVGRDRLGDLAVIKVDAPPEQLPPLPLGDSSQLKVGHLLIAIGNPFGFERTMTLGIVSGLGRPVEGGQRRPFTELIQTDAAINPGNSGGPLLNSRGEVVGINTFIDRRFVSVGFAIAVSTLKKALPDLLAGREVSHPWLGISGTALTPALVERFGLPVQDGILVSEVAPGSPAALAGLRPRQNNRIGDIIVAIDGRKVARVSDMVAYIETKSVGDEVKLSIIRDGQPMELTVELGNVPENLRQL